MKSNRNTKKTLKFTKLQRRLILTAAVLLFAAAGLGAYLAWSYNRRAGTVIEEPETEAVTEEAPVIVNPYWVNNVEIEYAGSTAISHAHIPWGSPRRPGEIREIHYLTIHETDNRSSGADSSAHSSLLTNDRSDTTGWHYTVDDHSIYHNIPDNEIGWNAGDNRTELGGNMNGIGIEMCVNLSNDFEATLRNTAELAAKLLLTYDLKTEDVRLHADFMDKVCPHRLMTEGRVEEFYEMIREAYDRLKMEQIRNGILQMRGMEHE